MALSIVESADSRAFTVGSTIDRELIFHVMGGTGSSDEEADVEALVRATAPAVYWGRVLDTISAQPQRGGIWKAFVRYSTEDVEITFDTGTGTQKLTQSLSTVASYAPPGMTAPDFGGAINVSDDRVEGTEIDAEGYEWTETHTFEDEEITYAYRDTLRSIHGKYNNASFRDFAAGEVKFRGANGGKRNGEKWKITFRFSSSRNITGATVGDITGIDKLGWQYAWMRYEDAADGTAHALVKRPTALYVEEVTTSANFALLGIGVS